MSSAAAKPSRKAQTATPEFDEFHSLILDERELVRNMKMWLAQDCNARAEWLEDNFDSLLMKFMSDHNAFTFVVFISEAIKQMKPSERLKQIFEYHVVSILNLAFGHLRDCWNVANKKKAESLRKVLQQWDKLRLFSSSDLKPISKKINDFIDMSNNAMTIAEDKESILFYACSWLNLLFDDLRPPANIIPTSYTLLRHIMYRVNLHRDEVGAMCLACVVLSGKLWWDSYGYVPVKHICRSYWKNVHVLEDYRVQDIDQTDEGMARLLKQIFAAEQRMIAAWAFDFTILHPIEKVQKLLDDVYKRLDAEEAKLNEGIGEECISKIKAYFNGALFGFSTFCGIDDVKLVIVAMLVIVKKAGEDTIVRWSISLKLDKSKIAQIVDKLREESALYDAKVKPLLELCRQKKAELPTLSASKSSASPAAHTPYIPPMPKLADSMATYDSSSNTNVHGIVSPYADASFHTSSSLHSLKELQRGVDAEPIAIQAQTQATGLASAVPIHSQSHHPTNGGRTMHSDRMPPTGKPDRPISFPPQAISQYAVPSLDSLLTMHPPAAEDSIMHSLNKRQRAQPYENDSHDRPRDYPRSQFHDSSYAQASQFPSSHSSTFIEKPQDYISPPPPPPMPQQQHYRNEEYSRPARHSRDVYPSHAYPPYREHHDDHYYSRGPRLHNDYDRRPPRDAYYDIQSSKRPRASMDAHWSNDRPPRSPEHRTPAERPIAPAARPNESIAAAAASKRKDAEIEDGEIV